MSKPILSESGYDRDALIDHISKLNPYLQQCAVNLVERFKAIVENPAEYADFIAYTDRQNSQPHGEQLDMVRAYMYIMSGPMDREMQLRRAGLRPGWDDVPPPVDSQPADSDSEGDE